MERPARYNNKGMTLIEVMIALLILMVVALAVMQTALVSLNSNLRNSIRDEAVNIVDRQMNQQRDALFSSIPLGASPVTTVTGTIRSGIVVSYQTQSTGTQIDPNTKMISMTVTWPFRGTTYSHTVTSIVRQQ